jgi:protein tyrosine phosphatase (PTP) superfamily phosphohydrolase (DUF442 family)
MFVRPLSFALAAKRKWRRSARLKRKKHAWRRRLSASIPGWMHRLLAPAGRYFDMLLLDHGVFRVIYANKHRLGARSWRSAQPAPHHIRALARQGVRTIVNLRGERFCGSYFLEKSACERHGITLVNFKVRSRVAPRREDIKAAIDLFDRIEYPMLLHCKSGADRAGLMSVLYRFLKEGVPIEQAKQQLSLRYGHFRRTETGILDYFFERYLEDNRRRPMPFLAWVDSVYDPEEVHRSFRDRRSRRRLAEPLDRETIWLGR